MSLYTTLIVEIVGTFCGYACGYGLEDNHGDQNHNRSTKWCCLILFLVRWLYTWLKVAEIIFYHQSHTWINGEPAHGKHDLDSIVRLFFAPWMSQAFKDHICTQLVLGYTIKQIYDKHKEIWWDRVNALKIPWWKMISLHKKKPWVFTLLKSTMFLVKWDKVH
jgi:hypothetical protein